MAKMKEHEKFAGELEQIFRVGDTSGDGSISKEEFHEMTKDPRVKDRFKKLELEMDEVDQLFFVLSAEDGEADYYEFLHAALKMKGSAKIIDAMQLQHGQLVHHRMLQQLLDDVHALNTATSSK